MSADGRPIAAFLLRSIRILDISIAIHSSDVELECRAVIGAHEARMWRKRNLDP